MPLFVTEGKNVRQPIASMPGQYRISPDLVVEQCLRAQKLGICAVALFPQIAEEKKDSHALESKNPDGLIPQTIRLIKKHCKKLAVITDVAMDPYSSDGHDGLVVKASSASRGATDHVSDAGSDDDVVIDNDATLQILALQALCQAAAGADFVAPSDMMDGRIEYIRQALDENGYTDVGIIAYAAKYASVFYGPFREALDSAPKKGDKKTYQMNPANAREALREVELDIREGADMVLVKPALAYLDIITRVSEASDVPVAAYNVSGEYAMISLMAEKGLCDRKAATLEVLTAIARAGADIIFTYHAIEAAEWLAEG
jgi:porphobilinogen synthase